MSDSACKLLSFAAGKAAKNASKQPGGLNGLTLDMVAAIHVYTQESPFYKKLNEMLRKRGREELKPYFPYLKLFLSAVKRLKGESCTL